MNIPVFRRQNEMLISGQLEVLIDENQRLRDQVVDLILQREITRERMVTPCAREKPPKSYRGSM